MSVTYVTHTCKNKACESAFMAEDLYNARNKPPTWRYCPKCEAQGLVAVKNPQNSINMARARKMRKTSEKAEPLSYLTTNLSVLRPPEFIILAQHTLSPFKRPLKPIPTTSKVVSSRDSNLT